MNLGKINNQSILYNLSITEFKVNDYQTLIKEEIVISRFFFVECRLKFGV